MSAATPTTTAITTKMDVTVEGPIDPDTGYVIDINVLKNLVEEKLLNQLDHKNLNLDVTWFQELIPRPKTSLPSAGKYWPRNSLPAACCASVCGKRRGTMSNTKVGKRRRTGCVQAEVRTILDGPG